MHGSGIKHVTKVSKFKCGAVHAHWPHCNVTRVHKLSTDGLLQEFSAKGGPCQGEGIAIISRCKVLSAWNYSQCPSLAHPSIPMQVTKCMELFTMRHLAMHMEFFTMCLTPGLPHLPILPLHCNRKSSQWGALLKNSKHVAKNSMPNDAGEVGQ